MPELPDVETFKRYLDATALHREIESVRVNDERVLTDTSPSALQRRLKGRRFENTQRHGKHLFAALSEGGWLMLHFGMSGFLRYFRRKDKTPGHVRVDIRMTNGYRLAYDSRRMLGQVSLVDGPQSYVERENLGPDALEDLNAETFRQIMSGRRGVVKSSLMNQRIIAGIGNVYSDEILFQARLHPETAVKELGAGELTALFESMVAVLETSIDAQADPDRLPAGFLIPRREENAACPRCRNGRVAKIKVSGRTAYYCPDCQKNPA